jgi:RimJ/RimL family protein N-acetyltransferase
MKPPILMDFPESFETERLLIRSPLPGDGPELHAAVRESIEELTPWMPGPKEHRTVEDSEASARRARVAFLQRSELRMHLYLKGTDTLVGSSGLQGIDWEVPKFEIGYWLRTRFAGQGYMTEAVGGIMAFAFDRLGARRVEIRCDSLNRRSARVAERGFLPRRRAAQRRGRSRRGTETYARLFYDPGGIRGFETTNEPA